MLNIALRLLSGGAVRAGASSEYSLRLVIPDTSVIDALLQTATSPITDTHNDPGYTATTAACASLASRDFTKFISCAASASIRAPNHRRRHLLQVSAANPKPT